MRIQPRVSQKTDGRTNKHYQKYNQQLLDFIVFSESRKIFYGQPKSHYPEENSTEIHHSPAQDNYVF